MSVKSNQNAIEVQNFLKIISLVKNKEIKSPTRRKRSTWQASIDRQTSYVIVENFFPRYGPI
jgi:hypothetical protein